MKKKKPSDCPRAWECWNFQASAGKKETYLRMMTLPWAVAVILPSSSMTNLATTLSSRNKPSGSFFPTAYQIPAYYGRRGHVLSSVSMSLIKLLRRMMCFKMIKQTFFGWYNKFLKTWNLKSITKCDFHSQNCKLKTQYLILQFFFFF